MNDKERQQGNIATGIGFIIGGVLTLGLMVCGIILVQPVLIAFMPLLSLMLFSAVVFLIRRGVINKKVAAEGKKGRCVIEKFQTVGGRGKATIWMTVSYVDDSGQKQKYAAIVKDEAITKKKKGMVLECRILGQECYIDPNNIKVIEGGETDE